MPGARFALAAPPAFRLDLSAWALCRRSHNRSDRWDEHGYHRTLALEPPHQPLALCVRQGTACGGASQLEVSLVGTDIGDHTLARVKQTLQVLLGLDIALDGFYRMADADPGLAALAQRFHGFRPPRFPNLFETLVNAISCQQITLSFGITLLNRLVEAYGRPVEAAEASAVANAFPGPGELADVEPEALRALGYSRQKAQSLIGAAKAVASGALDLDGLQRLDSAHITDTLTRLRGVGPWSAQYVLLRGLGRLDVFPSNDSGARNGLQLWLGRRERIAYAEIPALLARWRPYAGLVYFHLLLGSLERQGVVHGLTPAQTDTTQPTLSSAAGSPTAHG